MQDSEAVSFLDLCAEKSSERERERGQIHFTLDSVQIICKSLDIRNGTFSAVRKRRGRSLWTVGALMGPMGPMGPAGKSQVASERERSHSSHA